MILRPVFTAQLAERLRNGVSINLVSPHGQGRRRTLDDLRSLLPGSLCIAYIDLLRMNRADIEAAVAQCMHTVKPTLLIAHNIERVQDNTLLKGIIAVENRHNINILYVSENREHQLPIRTENLLLPPLSEAELRAEIKHRHLNLDQLTIDLLLKQPSPYSALEQLTA